MFICIWRRGHWTFQWITGHCSITVFVSRFWNISWRIWCQQFTRAFTLASIWDSSVSQLTCLHLAHQSSSSNVFACRYPHSVQCHQSLADVVHFNLLVISTPSDIFCVMSCCVTPEMPRVLAESCRSCLLIVQQRWQWLVRPLCDVFYSWFRWSSSSTTTIHSFLQYDYSVYSGKNDDLVDVWSNT